MKRLFQIAALMVVALLATEPLIAANPCSMEKHPAGQCARCCNEAMSQMSHGSCPMHSGMKSTGCDQNCCQHSLPKPTQQWNALPSSKSFIALVVLVLPSLELSQQQAIIIHPHGPPLAPSEPIYLLNQVFRI
jgi:hypothetical protein